MKSLEKIIEENIPRGINYYKEFEKMCKEYAKIELLSLLDDLDGWEYNDPEDSTSVIPKEKVIELIKQKINKNESYNK